MERQGERTDLEHGGNLPQGSGKTRDKLGAVFGVGGKTYEKAHKVVEAVEARERQGTRTDLTSANYLAEVDSGPSASHAAELLGTNKQYVSDAKRLKQEQPEPMFDRF